MPDLLIRNLPSELHERLKSAAAAHRRSVTQETIATIELGLACGDPRISSELPPVVTPVRPIMMEDTVRYADDGQR